MPARASISRRDLLSGKPHKAPFLPRPPGVEASSLTDCTTCGACVEACPEQILYLAANGVAIDPMLGECTFCGACAKACEEPVFSLGMRMAHRAEISEDCLVHAGVACMTCRDACPEEAITLRPRIGAPFLPVLDPSACTGCGACIGPCPAHAIVTLEREREDA